MTPAGLARDAALKTPNITTVGAPGDPMDLHQRARMSGRSATAGLTTASRSRCGRIQGMAVHAGMKIVTGSAARCHRAGFRARPGLELRLLMGKLRPSLPAPRQLTFTRSCVITTHGRVYCQHPKALVRPEKRRNGPGPGVQM